MVNMKGSFMLAAAICIAGLVTAQQRGGYSRPNIVLIYADDLGYGDISCNGATKVHTPNIDRLAAQGIRFTNGHASSATCTPSRYSMLTGQYAWRKKGTGIAPGNASLIIDTTITTLPSLLRRAGYATAAVGKWHLGVGDEKGPDWNGELKPGPLEIGFNYCWIMPATADRVPCVYVENHRVAGLDPNDPIKVSYTAPIGNEPTGKKNPELLVMKSSQGHSDAIVNGIGRIGFMQGGTAALWKDDLIAETLTAKAQHFIAQHKSHPFFLYFATHDIHVPRVPGAAFAGKSGLGVRGDAILQLDWTVGQIMHTLDSLHLTENTILVFSSDNGPVVDDGYQDQAVALLNGHKPSGPLRGGKYSNFDAGTRVPLIIRWPGHIKAGGTSAALLSQVDFMASFGALTTGHPLEKQEGPDSFDMMAAFTGKDKKGRTSLIEHAGALSIIKGNWKYIEPGNGARYDEAVDIELGNDPAPQLYDLRKDPGEQNNVAVRYPQIVKELAANLQALKKAGRSR
ncbi:sulfatase-like hydrolase/transferase [Chitinophaga nivalis]|uniref:Sulfatase-like hydrolase/transferase n=1 Tax=Chitinophaga nivalis TaxID=2991709 RepID=A0ABT3IT74_9BACT|nr:sulfatase-like hydrolase/transferase [Chitinophaga nivalis]MCW3463132.1 sulfatase-like hydrolase/transferase [Chitinophaga nivalis]MCW3487178.1 sulfatase-like hydrolase/transferase [Chitinophaga nivalis]